MSCGFGQINDIKKKIDDILDLDFREFIYNQLVELADEMDEIVNFGYDIDEEDSNDIDGMENVYDAFNEFINLMKASTEFDPEQEEQAIMLLDDIVTEIDYLLGC